MRDEVLIDTTVGAISDPVAIGDLDGYVFQIHAGHFHNNRLPSISASGLTGAEAVTLWKLTGGTWVKVYDDAGAAVQLTETHPQDVLTSEGVYGFSKTSGTGIKVFVQMP